jgi:hypothetical protein
MTFSNKLMQQEDVLQESQQDDILRRALGLTIVVCFQKGFFDNFYILDELKGLLPKEIKEIKSFVKEDLLKVYQV